MLQIKSRADANEKNHTIFVFECSVHTPVSCLVTYRPDLSSYQGDSVSLQLAIMTSGYRAHPLLFTPLLHSGQHTGVCVWGGGG